ncbi:MAG: hypothetical protein ABSH48_05070 [Verrucomicrobiota bacterium]|jgi:hypothetical protein
MTTETIVREEPVREAATLNQPSSYWDFPALCWQAIIGGTVVAIGIHILLTLLGMGAGLAAFSPRTDADPVTHFNEGAAVVWSACALVSLWFGGLIAGRYSRCWHAGFVHGILVWSLTLIVTLMLFSKGAGVILGGGLKAIGEALGVGAATLTPAVGNVGQAAVNRHGDELNSFVDEAAQSISTNGAPKDLTRVRRDVGFAVSKLFAPENEANFQDNRKSAIQVLTSSSHMSEADATKTVDDWIKSYNDLKAELEHAKTAAEQKARSEADEAARNLSAAATWVFFGLLLGLVVTALGGVCGAHATARSRGRLARVETRR